MNLRPTLENPFRNYALFSGRAGRAEFWLFVLTFIVITQLAWILGFGVMKIAGFDRGEDRGEDSTAQHQLMGKPEQDGAMQGHDDKGGADNMTRMDQEGRPTPDSEDGSSGVKDSDHDDMLNFMIHRHGEDGYHLHGVIHDDHISSYGSDDLDDEADHGRYAYRDYHRDRDFYVKFHKSRADRGGDILWAISIAALVLPLLAVGSRRLHDSNHSGWWQLLALIPVAGWLVLAVFFLLPGEEEDNRFGAPSAL